MTILKMHDTATVTIGTREYLTRHWYMDGGKAQGYDGAERHKRFYAQFATPQVRSIVSNFFTEKEWAKLAACEDEHLNGVFELSKWDRCNVKQAVGALYSDCCYIDRPVGRFYWAPSDNTCIVKATVKILLAIQKENQA